MQSFTYLVRQSKRKFDLVRNGISVPPSLDGSFEYARAHPRGGSGNA